MSESVRKLVQQNLSRLHKTVGEISQAVIVERSGLSPTMVSRILSGKDSDEEQGALQRVMAILAACNLVVVPRTYQHVDPEEYRAMQVLASKRLDDTTRSSDFGALA